MSLPAVNRASVLTPPGAGALAVIRVTGPDAYSLVSRIFRRGDGGTLSADDGGRLSYGRLLDEGEVVDDVIISQVTGSPSPAIDITAHGGVRVIERILLSLDRRGVSVDEPGRRPYELWPSANRIEAEAAEVVVRAKTERGVRFLAWQRENLVPALGRIGELGQSDPQAAQHNLQLAVDGFKAARTLCEGATVVLFGPANVGKSTLFNRLVGRPAAITSSQPGTTRDWVTASVEMYGVPITLVDTAGGVETAAPVDKRAIDAGHQLAKRADLSVLVLDGAGPRLQEGPQMCDDGAPPASILTVINKVDLGAAAGTGVGVEAIPVSAKTGAGVERFIRQVLRSLGFEGWSDAAASLFTTRQVTLAEEALAALDHDGAAAREIIERELIGR